MRKLGNGMLLLQTTLLRTFHRMQYTALYIYFKLVLVLQHLYSCKIVMSLNKNQEACINIKMTPRVKCSSTLILANISLNLSKSLRAALLFWTINFLPHELLSHFPLTSVTNNATNQYQCNKKGVQDFQCSKYPPAASIASIRTFFFGTLLISILISVRESLLKFIWLLTISGASTRACSTIKGIVNEIFIIWKHSNTSIK